MIYRPGSDPWRRLSRGRYIIAVLVMAVIVVLGFRPFYSDLLRGGTETHWLLTVHAAVFSGWLLLLLVQVALVALKRTRAHQSLGRFGIGYGILVLALGLVVSFAAPALHVTGGRWSPDEAAGFLLLPLGDMALFGAFFGAGIHHRRGPEIHKRWMVLAAIALIYPGAARLAFDHGVAVVAAVWLFPLGLLVAHEAVVRHRIDRVYLAGIAILLAALTRLWLMETDAWLVVGRGLLSPFLRGG